MGVLFLSHSSQDNEQATRVRDWLHDKGWADVFLDIDPVQGLAPGQRWQDELKRAGEKCAAVIVLISPAWAASRWCQTEFLVADQLGKRIFPVFIAPTSFDDLPLELKAKFQLADISTPDKEEEGFQRLLIGLKRAGLDPGSFEWPPAGDQRRPVYRGLQALDVQDAAIFFGRDAAITRGLDAVRRLRDGAPQRALIVLGASGAGKSSFLRAGLIARLRRDEADFIVLPVVRPEHAAITGAEGLERAVSAALKQPFRLNAAADLLEAFKALRKPVVEKFDRYAAAAGEQVATQQPTIVIPIDQAEEIFGAENTEGARLCALLAEAVVADGDAIVIATIRTDSYEPLQKKFMPDRQSVFTLPPIAEGAFKEVIEGPALLARPPLAIEPALTHQLLADLDAADALPLLAFTLERLQAQCSEDGKLALADYQQKLGGLSGAIQSAVANVMGPAPGKADLEKARRLFIPALVRVDHDGVLRRVANLKEVPGDLHDLAEKFVTQRLLVKDGEVIEVAHESILRQWPMLAEWIREERDALSLLGQIKAAATQWADDGRPENWMEHSGDKVSDAEALLSRTDFNALIDQEIRDYVAAWRQSVERALVAERRALAEAQVALGKQRKSVAAQSTWLSFGVIAIMLLSALTGAFFTYETWKPNGGAYSMTKQYEELIVQSEYLRDYQNRLITQTQQMSVYRRVSDPPTPPGIVSDIETRLVALAKQSRDNVPVCLSNIENCRRATRASICQDSRVGMKQRCLEIAQAETQCGDPAGGAQNANACKAVSALLCEANAALCSIPEVTPP